MNDKITITSSHRISRKAAIERVVIFAHHFGTAHVELASHAAFALVITPDLLYRIRSAFVPHAPWIAVSDILLSSLCREIGYGMYEMNMDVREFLLKELAEDERYGKNTIRELSAFVANYVEQQIHSFNPDKSELAQAERWNCYLYLDEPYHKKAIQEIKQEVDNLVSSTPRNDTAELKGIRAKALWMTKIIENLANNLSDHPALLSRLGWVITAEDKLDEITQRTIDVMTVHLDKKGEWWDEVQKIRYQAHSIGDEQIVTFLVAVSDLLMGHKPETLNPQLQGKHANCWQSILQKLQPEATRKKLKADKELTAQLHVGQENVTGKDVDIQLPIKIEIEETYRRVIAERCNVLSLPVTIHEGQDPRGTSRPLSLTSVYVSLNVEKSYRLWLKDKEGKAAEKETEMDGGIGAGDDRLLTALEAVLHNRHLVLLGGAAQVRPLSSIIWCIVWQSEN